MTATANSGNQITVEVNGKQITVKTEDATELITKLLAARKAAYAIRRDGKKAERVAGKAKREADRKAKLIARKAKLEAELAKLAA